MPAPKTGGTLTYTVQLVVGTRPEAIKLAPLAHALAAIGVAPRLLLTGQHPGLRARDHGLEGLPSRSLGCAGIDDPIEHAALVGDAVAAALRPDPPDLVVVQGDTSSALGGAEAADLLDLPLAHVEAGLRSFDRTMPWPEEDNRIAIDATSDLLFAPTDGAAANLRAERVRGEIHVTGNTGIDALFATVAQLPPTPPRRTRPSEPLSLLVTCHRRENWGGNLATVSRALVALAEAGIARIEAVLHPNPRVAGMMHLLLADKPNVQLTLPSDHRGMVDRMRRADLVLSDSGGIQEEAPALGVPLLVLRERTERPEALACGSALLVGTSAERIDAEVRRLYADRAALGRMARPALPFGDGHAAPRIARHIVDWLNAGERAATPATRRA